MIQNEAGHALQKTLFILPSPNPNRIVSISDPIKFALFA